MALHLVYFSPTGTGRTASRALVRGMAKAGFAPAADVRECDITDKGAREAFAPQYAEDDVLVFAFPVYGGRVPGFLAAPIAAILGNGALAVPVAVYGNRDIDDALLEAADLLEAAGLRVAAGTAFIGEHSFSRKVGTGRPDAADAETAAAFGAQIAQKLAAIADGSFEGDVRPAIRGNSPYKDGAAMPFAPKTTEDCIACGACVEACPMDNIDEDDPTQVGSACIQCNACVKTCPQGAKYFDDAPLMGIVGWLEGNCAERREPELFI